MTFERDFTADGNDRFLGNFELGIATKYIDDLRVNVRRGNRARFQRGWPNYRPGQGYLEDHATKTVIDDPLRFPLVRKMWDLLLSGQMRPRQILEEANTKWGYRTLKRAHSGDKPLSIGCLYAIFSNPYYMGIMRLKSGEHHQGAHHAMVTPEEFARAQEILGRGKQPRPVRHDFAYAGLLNCAACGGLLIAEEHVKRSGRRYVYYRCHGRRKSEPCRTPSLPEATFDAWLIGLVERCSVTPRAAEWIRAKLEQSLTNDLAQRQSAQDSIRAALDTAVREGDRLVTMRQRDQIDDATFDRRRLEILDRQAQLRLQLEQPAAKPQDLLAVLDQAMAFSARATELLRDRSIVGRRQILQAIGSNWRIDERKPLYLAKKPFSLLSGGTASSLWWTVPDSNRPPPRCPDSSGGPYRARTGHLRVANAALYQMS